MNLGFLGKGNAQPARARSSEQIEAGACGLKLHEDWGTTPAAIDSCLRVADEYDVQVAIHTDTLNESGFVEDTHRRVQGPHDPHLPHRGRRRRPRARHHQGRAAQPNVLPSSTNPTRPYTVNTRRRASRHADGLPPPRRRRSPRTWPSPRAASARETIAAEDILHDLGAFSMMSSDSQAMGRVGEVIIRTWQTAHKMKVQRGRLPEETGDNDNFRVKRYIAKYTINPAIAHGICARGRLDRGRQARRPGAVEAGVLRRQARRWC